MSELMVTASFMGGMKVWDMIRKAAPIRTSFRIE
jgi:hypothetical protein